jgi:molybdate transport system substrate-binding protein
MARNWTIRSRGGRSIVGGLLVLTILASGAHGQAQSRLTVFAAADLAFAFKEIVPLFERATGASVTLSIGSTGVFAQQIAAGAPADVFFAANASFVDDLIARGVVIPATRSLYAQGRIVLATRRDAPFRPTELRQLTDPRVKRIAIANPQHAPYGKAAEQALQASGLWDTLKAKLVYGDNIRHALQFLQTGAAEAGVVALSVANAPEISWTLVDARLHEPLNQVAVVVRRSQHPELGGAFIQFVVGPQGRPIMKRYGFLLPGDF